MILDAVPAPPRRAQGYRRQGAHDVANGLQTTEGAQLRIFVGLSPAIWLGKSVHGPTHLMAGRSS